MENNKTLIHGSNSMTNVRVLLCLGWEGCFFVSGAEGLSRQGANFSALLPLVYAAGCIMQLGVWWFWGILPL
ncbi:hypothetical protein P8452_65304 [Trifolium repens]|nr:hypothetical protein P8452_65304 [Trifolium repens]